MRKGLAIIAIALLSVFAAGAQTRYNYGQLSMERLNRGVVAVPMADGRVMVSWRVLRSEPSGMPYNILRNGVAINENPLVNSGTCFIDEHPLSSDTDVEYAVETLSPTPGAGMYVKADAMQMLPVGGSFTLKAGASVGYLSVPLQIPEGGQSLDGRRYRYLANDASVADVDGDGQYEFIVKWDPTNARDNAHAGFTGNTLFDCYRLDGQLLWRIDMGHNIRSGAHYVPFIVYDLNGDGRAEMMVRTADGTRDGIGTVIGDSAADYREKSNPRTLGRILTGPEYITVFDGLTGRALCTKPYIPARGEVRDWGDDRKGATMPDRATTTCAWPMSTVTDTMRLPTAPWPSTTTVRVFTTLVWGTAMPSISSLSRQQTSSSSGTAMRTGATALSCVMPQRATLSSR